MVNNGRLTRETGSNGQIGYGRRAFLKATGAGAAATTLAGCLGGDGDTEGFRVGHLAPLENPLGIGSLRSAQMAVEEINEDGGIGGGDLEIIEEDTRSDSSEAQSVTEDLIQQEDVDMLIGTFASEVAQAIIDLTADFEVPYFITGSASPELTRGFAGDDYDRYKNVFRIGPVNSDFQAEAVAGYCDYLQDRHGWDQVAFLRDQAVWTEPFAEFIPDLLNERGIDIVHEDALSIEIEDFSPVMSDVAESGADYVLRFFAHINAGQMLGIWHEAEYEFGIEGIHVASMLPVYYQATEEASLYETTSQTGAAGVAAVTEKTQPFVQAYRERYQDEENPPIQAPMYMGFGTYDGLFLAREAMDSIDAATPEEDLDGFIEAMLDMEYTGAAGVLEYYGPDSDYPHDLVETRNDEGDITNYPITQWQEDGQIECVYPEIYRSAEHVMPQWMQ